MKVIGVTHLTGYEDHLFRYINSKFTPGSVMLELPPGEEKISNYFGLLEQRLSGEWDVIRGDKYCWHGSEDRQELNSKVSELAKKYSDPHLTQISYKELLKDLSLLIASIPLDIFYMYRDAYTPSKISKRNEGLFETIEEFEPDLSVVGAAHALAIKKERPEIECTLFYVNSPIHMISLPITMGFSLLYSTVPDKIMFLPHGRTKENYLQVQFNH